MLIFHEGLPGSGKTYEAMAKHILPALERGRRVFSNVDGLDDSDCLSAIAECLAVPLETIKARLTFLSDEQIKSIWQHVQPNSLIVIDEIQNFFPVTREKPKPEISEWVSKHRHDGIDILAIGQNLKDVHNIWKRRIDRKIVFQKLDALGAAGRYRWVSMKCVGEMRFEKTVEGIEVYKSEFYGTYKSHSGGEISAELYTDKRAILWNSPLMRFVILFIALGGVLIPWYLYRQFNPKTSSIVKPSSLPVPVKSLSVSPPSSIQTQPGSVSPPSSIQTQPGSFSPPSSIQTQSTSVPDSVSKGLDYADWLASTYRVRLSSVLQSGGRTYVVVEFRDESLRLKDRLDQFALAYLGWSVSVMDLRMVKLVKGARVLVATPWPLESLGEVSDKHNEDVSQRPVKSL